MYFFPKHIIFSCYGFGFFVCFFYLIFYNFCHAEMLLKIKGKQDLKQKKKTKQLTSHEKIQVQGVSNNVQPKSKL